MNNEETQMVNEETVIRQSKEVSSETAVPMKKSGWKRVAISGVSGILLGSAATLLTSAVPVEDSPEQESGDSASMTESSTDMAFEDCKVAEGVNDEMSFGEAFAAARSEVGAGGVFAWRGNMYGTYYGTEWDSMSEDEKNAYWNRVHHTDYAANEPVVEEVEVVDVEPEIEVLGIETVSDDAGNEVVVGSLSIDDEAVAIVDIDMDGTFEVAMADIDHNGEISVDEVADIQQAGITTDDLMQAMECQDLADNGMGNDTDYYV